MATDGSRPSGVLLAYDLTRVGARMAAYIRLRDKAWQIRAVEKGIRPTARAVALAAGLPKTTMYRATRGDPPNAETIAALLATLDAPFEQLFERVDGGAS